MENSTPAENRPSKYRILYFPEDSEFCRLFLHCHVCMEEVGLFYQPNHSPCFGRSCKECFSLYIASKIRDSVAKIKCPGCKIELDYSEIIELIGMEDREKYDKVLLRDCLMQMPNYCQCPRVNCEGGGLFEPTQSFVVCNTCNAQICPHCREEFHAKLTCEQRREWKKMNEASETRTEKWKQANTKPCPKCNVLIQKGVGCDHMTCSRCQYEFCWNCMEKYYDGHIRERHTPPRSNSLRAPEVRPAQPQRIPTPVLTLAPTPVVAPAPTPAVTPAATPRHAIHGNQLAVANPNVPLTSATTNTRKRKRFKSKKIAHIFA